MKNQKNCMHLSLSLLLTIHVCGVWPGGDTRVVTQWQWRHNDACTTHSLWRRGGAVSANAIVTTTYHVIAAAIFLNAHMAFRTLQKETTHLNSVWISTATAVLPYGCIQHFSLYTHGNWDTVEQKKKRETTIFKNKASTLTITVR